METLLANYSIAQIISFIIIFALAIKGVVDFIDWAKNKMTNKYNTVQSKKEESKTVKERITKLENSVGVMSNSIDELNNDMKLLIKSDKDDIKAFITREHHYFCYKKGWIDDYSLDCIERRYEHYKEEKGNSFIGGLMADLRLLPKLPPETNIPDKGAD